MGSCVCIHSDGMTRPQEGSGSMEPLASFWSPTSDKPPYSGVTGVWGALLALSLLQWLVGAQGLVLGPVTDSALSPVLRSHRPS